MDLLHLPHVRLGFIIIKHKFTSREFMLYVDNDVLTP